MKAAGVVPAGFLSEACGLKGLRDGGAQVAEKHANFLINAGGATASDLRRWPPASRRPSRSGSASRWKKKSCTSATGAGGSQNPQAERELAGHLPGRRRRRYGARSLVSAARLRMLGARVVIAGPFQAFCGEDSGLLSFHPCDQVQRRGLRRRDAAAGHQVLVLAAGDHPLVAHNRRPRVHLRQIVGLAVMGHHIIAIGQAGTGEDEDAWWRWSTSRWRNYSPRRRIPAWLSADVPTARRGRRGR